MNRVAVTGFAYQVGPVGDGRNDAELLAPVVAEALGASGLSRDNVGVVCSASSEFLNGVVGSVMGAFDAFPGWPPRTHSHLEGDGAFALYEAWIRVLAGETDAALVCAYSRPLGDDTGRVLALQHDPYFVAPLAPAARELAALQARALLDDGRYAEADFATVVAARRPGTDVDELLRRPYVASPLRAADCSTVCAGAAALVLARDDLVARSSDPPAWITGIDQRIDSNALGSRDLTTCTSVRAAAARLGLTGATLDVLEVHTPFSHQELMVVEALGAAAIRTVNPSGGALPADPVMATGLIRLGVAADEIRRSGARRAVGHATNGPCLQHNLLCAFEADS
ncbi:MAG TPA: lipid-transfer protein [Acidimicrobiia bacterium]|nr:lipid-transfer protein [Acidimicrobiia bacterium]